MSLGDKDKNRDERGPAGEPLPEDPSMPDVPDDGDDDDEDGPKMPDVPTPEPDDVPGISVHVPDRKRRAGGILSFAPLFALKRWMWGPIRSYKGTPRRKAKTASLALASIVALAILVPVIWLTANPLPDVSMLEEYKPIEGIKIYDIHDKLAAVVSGAEDRQVVKLSQVSPEMKKAMLAAEDHEFYSHGGFNATSIIRAAIKNFQAGHVVEGASTITQQLVKNLFFPGEARTINRKIKEVILATQVDQKYSKDQILEMYLNQIYFGNQAYGIERAAQRYFSKPASKLTLAEGAFLAGVVKAPTYLSDPDNRKAALARQNEVLDKLAEYKLATKQEVDKAKQQKLAFRKYVSPFQKYAFYVAYVMDQLRSKYGDDELKRGLNVYTNLDPQAQMEGEKALAFGISHAPAGVEQGALASIRINDGAVLALVGGVGQFEKIQWNRAVSPHTMGSSFKPFVYLTGFLQGMDPEDIIVDSPVSFPSGGSVWTPRNFEGGFMGAMPIKKALAQSRNVCAAKVAHEVGIENVIKTARLAGLTSTIEPYLPVSLGAAAASPLEMAGAYSTFARGGVRITPQIFRRIENTDGTVVATFSPEPRKVFDSHAIDKLLVCMKEVVTHGTGILAQLDDHRPLAGKTGTADASRDIWFVGFTPDTCTAVWGGNDHNKAIANKYVTGGMIMSKIFKQYMTAYYQDHPTPIVAFMKPGAEAPQVASAKELDKKKLASAQAAAKAKIAKATTAKPSIIERKIEQAAVVKPETAPAPAPSVVEEETAPPMVAPAAAAESPKQETPKHESQEPKPEPAKVETPKVVEPAKRLPPVPAVPYQYEQRD